MINRLRARRSNRRGASAVEFAFVAPALFFLLWTSFEFLRVSMMQNQADIASYEAARAIMVPGATIAEGEAEVDKYLNYLGSRDLVVNITPYEGDVAKTEINDFTSRIEVYVEIPIRSNVLILSRFFGDRDITSTTSLTFESYSGFYDGSSN
ncbi:MAG: TadE/TadG family type IV pilus assembly protein [Pirellulaceae bacterium]